MRQELREKHPDVIAKQKEVEQVQGEMKTMIDEWQDKIKTKQERLQKTPDLSVASVEA
jgi:gas vesicle protein